MQNIIKNLKEKIQSKKAGKIPEELSRKVDGGLIIGSIFAVSTILSVLFLNQRFTTLFLFGMVLSFIYAAYYGIVGYFGMYRWINATVIAHPEGKKPKMRERVTGAFHNQEKVLLFDKDANETYSVMMGKWRSDTLLEGMEIIALVPKDELLGSDGTRSLSRIYAYKIIGRNDGIRGEQTETDS